MSIIQKIEDSYKEALKNKETNKFSTIRLILSAKKDKEIEKRTQDKKDINDEDMINILNKMIKQRRESIEMYIKGSRQDLANKEQDEIKVLESFLPKQFSPDEIKNVCIEVIKKTGATSIKDMGKVMQVLKQDYLGKIDFAYAGKILKELIQK
jgi:uncharacterized protein YqeY